MLYDPVSGKWSSGYVAATVLVCTGVGGFVGSLTSAGWAAVGAVVGFAGGFVVAGVLGFVIGAYTALSAVWSAEKFPRRPSQEPLNA
jgi:hypothetical protein